MPTNRKENAMAMTKEKAIERAFDRCNLIGDEVDILSIMYQYKALRELPEEEQDRIYDDIADRLASTRRFERSESNGNQKH